MRILYIHSTLVPPPTDPRTDRFFLLSETLEGDVLQPVWFKSSEEVEAAFGPGSYPIYERGCFRYHWFLAYRFAGIRRKLAGFWFYLRKGVQLHRQRPFDCIIAYSHMTTGLLAALVKLATGAKLIIEVVTSPHLVYLTERPRPTLHDRLMRLYSDLCLHASIWSSDRAHLLYPTQLGSYRLLRKARASVFHEFVPLSAIPPRSEDGEPYVLLVGAPWYLKGADRLIQAFLRLAPDFPQVKLKLLGWYPDHRNLRALTGDEKRIEIVRATPHKEALELISRCAVLVLPSRCEGLPRVLMEGMGAGVAVIGSEVGGIPYIVHHGENGFVVPGGEPKELEARLRELLADPGLRARMGARGRELARTQLSERIYVDRFTEMVERAVQDKE